MSLLTPAAIQLGLQAIDADMAERTPRFETAADDYARFKRLWDKRLAEHTKRATGSNADERKAKALVAAIEQDDLYENLTDAEARYEALKVVMKSLENRSAIGMSLLKVQR